MDPTLYKCLNCGKLRLYHQAKTHNCPLPTTSRTFRQFHATKYYEPDLTKPLPIPKFIL